MNMKVRLTHEDNISATIIAPASLRVRDENGRELDVGIDEVEPVFPPPSPELSAQAHQRALQAADEQGVPIDRICIAASPDGSHFQVIVLEEADQDWSDEEDDEGDL